MVKKTICFIFLLLSSIFMFSCNSNLITTTTTEQSTTEQSTTGQTTTEQTTTEQTTTEISTTNETTTTEILYEVIFNSTGGTPVDSLLVPEGGSIALPTVEREGYTFDSWYYDDDLSILYTSTTMSAQDINLFAKWTINQFTIRYYTLQPKLNSEETILSTSFSTGHSSAITSEGRIFTWGDNLKGKLGNDTTVNQYTPVDITSQFNLNSGETVLSVSLGELHSAAVTSESRVFTWGYNYNSQLGDGTTTDRYIPIDITSQFSLNGGETVISVTLGAHHSAALTSEGRLFIWGWNYYGQLGNGSTTDQNTPTDITSQFSLTSNETIVSVSLGENHSSVITSEGRIFTWGYNYNGELGDGTTTDKYYPTDITSQFNLNSGETVISAYLGEEYSSAVTSEARIFTWGNNVFGQLGDGTTTDKFIPTDITSQFSLNSGEAIISVSLGGDHSSVITSEGRIFTWGYNGTGQLGDGTRNDQYTPTDITSQFILNTGETIISVSLGKKSSSVVTSIGRTFTWGFNGVGQLGDGTITNIKTPYNLLFISKIFMVSETFDYNVSVDAYLPTLEGYTFGGWFIDEALSMPYLFTTMPAQNISLYAKWIQDA